MVEPLYNPLSVTDLARAMLLVRLHPGPPPQCRPCEETCPPKISDYTLSRRQPDLYEPSQPVPFSTYLRRQNEEYRAARERLESCPSPAARKPDNAPPAKMDPPTPLGLSTPAERNSHPPVHKTTSPQAAYRQRLLSPTGRMVDLFF